jgi:hypothetical protein|tara:strand:- start:315 stop:578 length:264 start_codon:yes stop_codon:yes gene_type:complete
MKSKNKINNKERDKQISLLFQSLFEVSQEVRMVRTLLENYLIWKKDVKKFTKYLQEQEEKRESEAREAQPSKGSGASKASGKPSKAL